MDALGLGLRDLAAINPKLIYASMSAFGQDGPRRTQTAYDQVIQASSGLMATSGTPDFNPLRQATPGHRLRQRNHRRLCTRQRPLPARTHRQGPAHRHGDARCRAGADGTHLTVICAMAGTRRRRAIASSFATIGIYQTKAGQ